MINRYLIAFSFIKDNVFDIANVEIEAPAICSMEEIQSMEIEIAKKYKLPSIVIINWKKFEKPL